MNYSAAIAQSLLAIEAIQLNPQQPFTWASGLKSPIYCDNRVALSYPDTRTLIIAGLLEKIQLLGTPSVIAGVATAGIPNAAIVADRLGLPLVYVRSSAKGHGRQNQIEGQLSAGQSVVVIEDLISTGGSALQAVQALRESGASVTGVVATFTYELAEAAQAFAKANCRLEALTNYTHLLQIATDQQRLHPAHLQTLKEWRHSPAAWSTQWETKNSLLA